jgi:hypothetical protein
LGRLRLLVKGLENAMDTYPEHAKLKTIAEKTQFTADFFDFLEENGIFLSSEESPVSIGRRDDLLYRFIGVDHWKLEDEKRAMLDRFREIDKEPK